MGNRKRLVYLLLNLAIVSAVVAGTTIFLLYQTAFDQQRDRLMETVQSQARFIESVARYNVIHWSGEDAGGPERATLEQITEAHRQFKGFGETGELVMARKQGEKIVFLLSHRHFDLDNPKPLPLSSPRAAAMKRALSGRSGSLVGLDYRGERVLAAYEPVAVLNVGIVAKIDLAEIRTPFIRAAKAAAVTAAVLIAVGMSVFLFLINPMIEKLQESEGRYRQLFDSAADMIFLHDPRAKRLVDVNPAACRLLGRDRRELLGRDCFELLASARHADELARLSDSAGRGGMASTVVALGRKDGSTVETELRVLPVVIAGRELILCLGRDLTAQHQLERRALAFYQAFRNSNDFMFYTDRNGIIQDVNDAFIRRFGYLREEAVGRSPRLIRSPNTPDSLYKKLWQDILDPTKGFWRGRLTNRAKSGEEVPILLSITAVRNDDYEIIGFVSSAVDLTEQEELQRRLTQSESLAAVGSMAAVVAHEIRNPLGSIVTAARSISRGGLPPDERETLLQVIREESNRLNETLTQFLQYARPRPPNLKIGDLNKSLEEILSILRSDPETTGAVEVLLKLEENLPPFRFDDAQLRQVIWNIVINALQAMSGKGALTISTTREAGRVPTASGGGACSPMGSVDRVRLCIEDTGPGIPEDQRAKIFQPFHTTKQKGTGLGLPVAERIVSAHGGSISVSGGREGGSIFTITLPLDKENA